MFEIKIQNKCVCVCDYALKDLGRLSSRAFADVNSST